MIFFLDNCQVDICQQLPPCIQKINIMAFKLSLRNKVKMIAFIEMMNLEEMGMSKEMMMETMNLKCSLSILCRGWLGMRQRCMARANVSTKKCV